MKTRIIGLFSKRVEISEKIELAIKKTITYYSGFFCGFFDFSNKNLHLDVTIPQLQKYSIRLNVSSISILLSIFELTLHYRLFVHKLQHFFEVINKNTVRFNELRDLTYLDKNKLPILEEVRLCKIKFASGFVNEEHWACLRFIESSDYLVKTTMFSLDLERAVTLTENIKTTLFLKSVETKIREQKEAFDGEIYFFPVGEMELVDFENPKLIYKRGEGMDLGENSLREKHLKMTHEN